MKVSEIGEFGLIARITSVINKSSAKNSTARRNLLLGIGDDAAAWKTTNSIQLATTDILVEGIHFYLDYTNWRDLGWKALAVNISDIASSLGFYIDFINLRAVA
jgi:thiamine-monophosphate kinase